VVRRQPGAQRAKRTPTSTGEEARSKARDVIVGVYRMSTPLSGLHEGPKSGPLRPLGEHVASDKRSKRRERQVNGIPHADATWRTGAEEKVRRANAVDVVIARATLWA
jgi:hypothetical protein